MADPQTPKRELSSAPGFPCPQCGVRIRIALATFLSANEITCPGCGLSMQMDKSQCTRMVELLQDLRNADEDIQALTHPKL